MNDYERGYHQGKSDATKLMQQALDALEKIKAHSYLRLDYAEEAITALRERLAQPEQGPVTGNLLKDAYNAVVEKKTRSQKLREAGFTRRPKGWEKEKEKDEQEPVAWEQLHEHMAGPFYKAPRPWVGLTDEERYLNDGRTEEEIEYAKAIEAKLKEKNKHET